MGDINQTLQPFQPLLGPNASTVGISATASSVPVTLPVPLQGQQPPSAYEFVNVGAATVFVALGPSGTAATVPTGSTPGSYCVPAGTRRIITAPANPLATTAAAIGASAGPTLVYVTPGYGSGG